MNVIAVLFVSRSAFAYSVAAQSARMKLLQLCVLFAAVAALLSPATARVRKALVIGVDGGKGENGRAHALSDEHHTRTNCRQRVL